MFDNPTSTTRNEELQGKLLGGELQRQRERPVFAVWRQHGGQPLPTVETAGVRPKFAVERRVSELNHANRLERLLLVACRSSPTTRREAHRACFPGLEQQRVAKLTVPVFLDLSNNASPVPPSAQAPSGSLKGSAWNFAS